MSSKTSIILCTYNEANYIENAISELEKNIPNVEIIRAGKKTDRRIILTTDSEKTEIAIVKIPFLDFNSNNVFML